MQKKYLLLPFLLYIILLVIVYKQTHIYAINQAEIRVEEFLENYKALRTYVSKYQKSEIFKLQSSEIIHKDFFVPSLLSSTFSARTINHIYNDNRIKEKKIPLNIKFASDNPRNILNKATKKESKILEQYNNKILTGSYKEIENKEDGTFLFYVLPTKLNSKKCMKCHSRPSFAPKDLLKKYGNKNGFYEKIGDMRAIVVGTMKIDDYLVFAKQSFFILSLLITIIFCIILFSFYKFSLRLRKESEVINNILNSQVNLILITNGDKVQKVNKRILDFFWYKTLDDFHKEHTCICDFFIKEDGYLKKEQNGKTWIEVMLENKEIIHQVKIKDLGGKIHFFQTNTSGKIIKDDSYVITFTDVTDFNAQQHKLREKDLLLLNQSKMASMGEMIGNIAHQWRQPLSVISAASTGIIMQKECGVLEEDKLIETCNTINNNTQYLSKTIDDFKNFIKGDRAKKIFNLKDKINIFLHLLEGSIKNNHINIILDLQEDIKIDGYQNELTQCFINIFNNAKDILVEKKIEDKYIFISTSIQNDKAIIKIKDNAGGIPKDILSKIFEPYFTTKHQSQGTGLGLHMTYNLISDGMSGTIEAHNIDYEYNGKEYTGAEFIIILALN